MSKPRDYLSDIRRYYLPKARTHASNAWHRAAGRHIQGAKARFSNWRNHREIDMGRRDLPRRMGDEVRSRTPVMRDRINRGTGQPHRQDRDLGNTLDRTLRSHRDSIPPQFRQRSGRSR